MIQSETADTGGPGLNMAVDLARLGCGFPVAAGRAGRRRRARPARARHLRRAGHRHGGRRRPAGRADVLHRRDDRARHRPAHLLPLPGRQRASWARSSSTSPTPRPGSSTAARPGVHERMDAPTPGGNGFAEVLARARAAGLRTNLELVCVEPERIRALAAPCLPHLDTIIINELEAAAITGQRRSAGRGPRAARPGRA